MGQLLDCQACGKPIQDDQEILDIGEQPLVHNLRKTREEAINEPRYPLRIVQCAACDLVQLDYIPDAIVVFPPEYPYRSGMTGTLKKELKALAVFAQSNHPNRMNHLGKHIMDIGGNDGTLLNNFHQSCTTVNVEPTKAGASGRNNRHRWIPEFFPFFNSSDWQDGRYDIITAANVFAHTPYPKLFLEGVRRALKDDGVFVFANHYLLPLLERCQYDTVYHEHARYYHFSFLETFLAKYGFIIIDAKETRMHGGGIMVACKKQAGPRKPIRLSHVGVSNQFRRREKNLPALLDGFPDRVEKQKATLVKAIRGRKIFGFAAPARSSTLINHMEWTENDMAFVMEQKDSPKCELYLPGSGIQVVEEDLDLIEAMGQPILDFLWYLRPTPEGWIPAISEENV